MEYGIAVENPEFGIGISDLDLWEICGNLWIHHTSGYWQLDPNVTALNLNLDQMEDARLLAIQTPTNAMAAP